MRVAVDVACAKPLRGTPNGTVVKDVSNQVGFIVLGQRFYCSSDSKSSVRTIS